MSFPALERVSKTEFFRNYDIKSIILRLKRVITCRDRILRAILSKLTFL